MINSLMKVSAKLPDIPGNQNDCYKILKLLSLLPASVAPIWRLHTIKKAWSQGHPDLQGAVIRCLPLVYHTFGQHTSIQVRT